HGGTWSFSKVSLSIEEVQDQDLGSWKLSEVIARYSRRTPVDRNLNIWPSTMHHRNPSKAIVVEGKFSGNSEFLTLYSSIVSGHLVSNRDIEVDKAKIDIISSLSHHESMWEDVDFVFDQPCIKAFQELKKRLTTTPILLAPDWELPFYTHKPLEDVALELLRWIRRRLPEATTNWDGAKILDGKFCTYLHLKRGVFFISPFPLFFRSRSWQAFHFDILIEEAIRRCGIRIVKMDKEEASRSNYKLGRSKDFGWKILHISSTLREDRWSTGNGQSFSGIEIPRMPSRLTGTRNVPNLITPPRHVLVGSHDTHLAANWDLIVFGCVPMNAMKFTPFITRYAKLSLHRWRIIQQTHVLLEALALGLLDIKQIGHL
ncbi:hypothetical protein CR513_04107, partial [Mucuna pruriens]